MTATHIPTAQEAKAYQEWAWDNPVQWIRHALGVRLWSKQAQVARAVRKHPLVACRSGHSIGKSVLAASVALWYLNALPNSRVVTTSSTWTNLKDILWAYIPKLIRQANCDVALGGNILDTQVEVTDGWGIYAVSPQKPDAIGGYHSETGVLVVVDEASALEQSHAEAIDGITTTTRSRQLLLGNPLYPAGPFYEACNSPHWHALRISSTDSPNMTEGREVVPGLASPEWLERQKAKWGEDTDAYRARVLGEFPASAEDSLIPRSWEPYVVREPEGRRGPLRMGVDVARFGGDRTVLLVRDNLGVVESEQLRGRATTQVAGAARRKAVAMGIRPENVYVDVIGIGAGVVDAMHDDRFSCTPVNFSERATDPERFENLRDECYWMLREAVSEDRGGVFRIPPDMRSLWEECTSIRYSFTRRGQYKLESKDDIRKRLGRSPDEADALALTFAPPPKRPKVGVWTKRS